MKKFRNKNILILKHIYKFFKIHNSMFITNSHITRGLINLFNIFNNNIKKS